MNDLTTPDIAAAESVDLAMQFEGFSATPYKDASGVWTIGYGSTLDATGRPIWANTAPVTQSQARAMLMRDLHSAFEVLASEVRSPLTDNERAALADFIYNVGAGNFRASTLLRLLNAGDLVAAAAQFDRWIYAGGKPLAGLARRRAAEQALYLKPDAA